MMDKETQIYSTLLSILVLHGTSLIYADPASLWGRKVDFMRYGCTHWELAHSIPSLKGLSVCVEIQRSILTPHWTVFMYSHPGLGHVDIGLKGRDNSLTGENYLLLWLFGRVWSTTFKIRLNTWYSVCITWSEVALSPRLYINGNSVDISYSGEQSGTHTGNYIVADGHLTLGASHFLNNGKMHLETGTDFQGNVTRFRMWNQELPVSQLEQCVDGNVVRWMAKDWHTHGCAPVDDTEHQCVWSLYEVQMNVMIYRWDTQETNEYKARDLVHNWVENVLPPNMYIHTVLVSKLERDNTTGESTVLMDDSLQQDSESVMVIPIENQFACLVYLNVIPGADVSLVQHEVKLQLQNEHSADNIVLFPVHSTIYISPVESLPVVTLEPPHVTTMSSPSTSPALVVLTTASTTGTFLPSSIVTGSKPGSVTSSKPISTFASDQTMNSSAFTIPSISVSTEGTVSESFFKVDLTVTLAGSSMNAEQKIQAWINETLTKEKMSLLNFEFLWKASSLTPIGNGLNNSEQSPLTSRTSHNCRFHVQATTSSTINETIDQIRNSLEVPYDTGSVILDAEPDQIIVCHITPGPCPQQQHQTRQGLFNWPKTSAQHVASYPCEGNTNSTAERKCLLASNNKARWAQPDLQQCPYVVATIPDLEGITVTAENANDVLDMIQCLLSNHTDLNDHELSTILNKLSAVVNITKVTPALGKVIVEILSDILESNSNFHPVTNNILDITESIGDRLSGFSGENFSLVAPGLAISVVNVCPDQFHNLTFGVSSPMQGKSPEVYINQHPFDSTVAFISLPPSLRASFPSGPGVQPRILFQFFGTPALFKDGRKYKALNTFVVSASVTNATGPIQGLKEPVAVTLHHLQDKPSELDVLCVFWNFSKKNSNGGLGGWDPTGCYLHNTSYDHTTCLCDHLTHFGVLLDLSRTPVDETNGKILTIISYIGCGVSSIFLGVTVLTYTAFEKLRRDYPSKILLNLALALEGLNLIYLLNSWLSSLGSSVLCVAVAITMHYFLLASFTWMGLEAVNMYFALVKVFNVYVPSYILKFCALGWGIPLIICGLVLILRRDGYGSAPYGASLEPSDDVFCWVQDDVTFYVSVVGYILLVLLFNMAVFLVVLVQLRNMRFNRPAGMRSGLFKDLRGVASLTFLLGLTWAVALFTWGPVRVPLLYMFSILNSLQGFFLFLFYCLMKENVRKQWRVHLCFGRFRLQDYSEWSQTATVPAKTKLGQAVKFPSVKSVRSNKSSTTESTSASSDSSQREVSIRRPNLGLLCLNGLTLPRAQPTHCAPVHRDIPLPQEHGYAVSPWLTKAGSHLESDIN
ncbi:adhesion G-protein coupled receptor G4 [Alosa sapidissima]|uniref:adhesion G-protein coupled receptor G4 n=1 Tax=Alosa sapidissima TaxID=34773 RepID=UPI001C098F57|nr:adhesion G-protein coupled receptor G4 [Alosa sapidissima]